MHNKIAVVTGANRGLGFETSRQLAARGYHVIMTARDAVKGQTAVQQLKNQKLDVEFHPLDVTNSQSIQTLANHIKKHHGKFHSLVNNAGVFSEPMDNASILKIAPDVIQKTFITNTMGPVMVAQALVPLMNDYGNIVNVSSGMGQLSDMNGFWPGYRISKTGLNAVTRILADELKSRHIKVNSVCPGWVRTDMGGADATRPVEQGAETIVWAATLDDKGPSGGFFRDKKSIPW
jgi:NAD(P)-dependent dehydrogenase (short-subunit alcohol dehydrogenase family)